MNKLDNINYLEIFKKAWKITWENKYLWWFGLFLVLGGGFNFDFPRNFNGGEKANKISDSMANFLSSHEDVVLAVIFILFFLWLVFVVLGIISKAGLLKTLVKIEKNEINSFKDGFKNGKKYFWKLIGISLILGFSVFVLVFVLSVPVILLFIIKSIVLGIFAAFLAILIFIPLVILAYFLGRYSNFYIVLSELGIKSSLENSYLLFRKNIFPSIIMALFFIPVSITLFFIVILTAIIVGIIFLIIGFILYAIFSNAGVIITVIFGSLVLLALFIFISSVYQVFCQTAWLLFFKEIASVEEEEIEEEVLEKEVAEKSLPNPEEA
jgi:hypothetical protein